jgi:hypothetical protein
MQSLTDLLSTQAGRNLLAGEAVFVDRAAFEARLAAPARSDLAQELGAAGKMLICSGQQIYVDYRQSVLSKLKVLRDLSQDARLFPFFVWVDTDRAGSDNLMTKFAWPASGKKGPISIMPAGGHEIESRFAAVDPAELSRAMDRLETHLRQSGERRAGAKDRYQELRALFTEDGHGLALSEFNLRVTHFLLGRVLDFVPPALVLSRVLDGGLLAGEIERFLARRADVVRVFNEKRASLLEQGIDPQVRPLDEDYLPLFYSCEADGTRLRLHFKAEGGGDWAVAGCRCGRVYRFDLGSERLFHTRRWSLDVCFPLFLNEMVSGLVGGKSSAIYLMVTNDVLRKVLGRQPVPILVPQGLNGGGQIDSLLYRYFAQA